MVEGEAAVLTQAAPIVPHPVVALPEVALVAKAAIVMVTLELPGLVVEAEALQHEQAHLLALQEVTVVAEL